MTSLDMDYFQMNLLIAQRLLIYLEDRRLLLGRFNAEDQEYCRRSADDLRGVLGGEMLAVRDGGMLLAALRDMRRACNIFVSAAGPEAKEFKTDDDLFSYHLVILRTVFAQRVGHIVEEFELDATDEVKQIIQFVG